MTLCHLLSVSWRHYSVAVSTFANQQTDHGSLLDLIFANCDTFCDAIEAYWTDHKLIYCALDT